MNGLGMPKKRMKGEVAMAEQQARFVSSGMTTQRFCELEGISTATFYKRRSRVRDLGVTSGVPTKHQVIPVISKQDRQEFIDIGSLSGGGAANIKAQVHIDLGGGVVLQLSRYA
jgi:hypothetical protein